MPAHDTDAVPERDGSRPMLENWAPLLCAVLAATIAALMIVGTRDFALDDAWIHLCYAKSLRLGDGLSYNPGDWETGFSSPLWVLVLSVWPIEGNPVAPVKLLGVLLHAVTAWAGASLVLDVARERASGQRPLPLLSITLLAGTLVAITPTLVHAATSGMEVPLAAALLFATMRAAWQGRTPVAAVLGGLAVLARPEALFVLGAFGLALALWRRRVGDPRTRAPVAGAGGALVALAAWVVYCLAISGDPWPNTQYIKGTGGGLAGLAYLRLEVLPLQPWIVSLTGLALLGLALVADIRARKPETAALLLAWLATVVAIAVSRPLHPGVQFYESRYFAIVAGLPLAAAPLGLLAVGRDAKPWQRYGVLALVLPLAVVCGLQVQHLRGALADQSDDTRTVHTAVARSLAETLPEDAVVGVEGAGAARFFAPRSMTIVDLVGLNDHDAAHAHLDPQAKICHFVGRGLTHTVLPLNPDFAGVYAEVFFLRPLARFDDLRYTQTLPAGPLTVVVFAVEGVRPAWAQRCASL